METKTISIREVAERLVKDETPKCIGIYKAIGYDEQPDEFCAIGAVAEQLGVDGYALGSPLASVNVTGDEYVAVTGLTPPPTCPSVFLTITDANDYTDMTKTQIGQAMLDRLPYRVLDAEVEYHPL